MNKILNRMLSLSNPAYVPFLTYLIIIVSTIVVRGEDCLSSHNKYRALHGVQPLRHDPTLEKFAMQRAQSIAQTDIFAHPSNLRYGENLYWSSGTVSSCDAAVTAWYNENRSYNYDAGQFSKATGHFTQLIWKGSQSVGCATAKSKRQPKIYVVCNYNPKGNIAGRFKENVPRRVNNRG